MRHPVALFKVDGLEGTTPAAPMIGRAAEIAQTRSIERIGHADALAFVKRLGFGLEIEAAAFNEGDMNIRAAKRARNGDARRARADNGDIGFDHGAVRHLPPVDKHISLRL